MASGWDEYKRKNGIVVRKNGSDTQEPKTGWEQYKAQHGLDTTQSQSKRTGKSNVKAAGPDTWQQWKEERAYQNVTGHTSVRDAGKRATHSPHVAWQTVTTKDIEEAQRAQEARNRVSKNVGKGEAIPLSSKNVGKGEAIPPSSKNVGKGEMVVWPRGNADEYDKTMYVGAGEVIEQKKDSSAPGFKAYDDVRMYADDLYNRFGPSPSPLPSPSLIGTNWDDPLNMQRRRRVTPNAVESGRVSLDLPLDVTYMDTQAASRQNLSPDYAKEMMPDFIETPQADPNYRTYLEKGAKSQENRYNEAQKSGESPYAYMTPEEGAHYSYVLGKFGAGKAEDYYKSILDDLNVRIAQEEFAEYMSRTGVARGASNVGAAIESGLSSAVRGFKQTGELALSAMSGRDPYAIPTTPAQYKGAAISEELDENSGWGVLGKGYKSILFDVGASVAEQVPSIIASYLTAGVGGVAGASASAVQTAGKVASLGTMAASVAGNTYSDSIRSGLTHEQALMAAVASATIEVATEQIGGVGFLSFGTWTDDAVDAIIDMLPSAGRRFAARLTANGIGEAMEELVSGVLDPVVETYVLRLNDDAIRWGAVMKDALIQSLEGALSGIALGGPSAFTQYVREVASANVRQAAKAVAPTVMGEEATAEQKQSAVKQVLEVVGVQSEEAQALAGDVVKVISGEKLTEEEEGRLSQSTEAVQAMQAIVEENAAENAPEQEVQEENAPLEETAEEPDVEEAAGEPDTEEEKRPLTQEDIDALTAYRFGQAGMTTRDFESARKRDITERERGTFETGRQEMIDARNERQARIQDYARNRPENRKAGVVDITPEYAQSHNVMNVDRSNFSDEQNAAVKALEYVSETTGLKFVLYDSPIGENGEHVGDNGWYDDSTQTAYIDVSSGYGEQAILRTAAHEVTHFIENWNPQEYETMRDFLVEYYHGTGEDTLNDLVYMAMAKAEDNGRIITEKEAMHEVVANACEMMLSGDEETIRTLAKKHVKLFVRVKLWLDSFVDAIRRAFRHVTADSREAVILAENMDKFREAQRMWFSALEGASVSLRGEVMEELHAQVEEIEKEGASNPGKNETMIPGTSLELVDYTNPARNSEPESRRETEPEAVQTETQVEEQAEEQTEEQQVETDETFETAHKYASQLADIKQENAERLKDIGREVYDAAYRMAEEGREYNDIWRDVGTRHGTKAWNFNGGVAYSAFMTAAALTQAQRTKIPAENWNLTYRFADWAANFASKWMPKTENENEIKDAMDACLDSARLFYEAGLKIENYHQRNRYVEKAEALRSTEARKQYTSRENKYDDAVYKKLIINLRVDDAMATQLDVAEYMARYDAALAWNDGQGDYAEKFYDNVQNIKSEEFQNAYRQLTETQTEPEAVQTEPETQTQAPEKTAEAKKPSRAFINLLKKWMNNEQVNIPRDGSRRAKAFETWAFDWYNAGRDGLNKLRAGDIVHQSNAYDYTAYPPFLEDTFFNQGVKERETELKRQNTKKPVKKKEDAGNGKEAEVSDNGAVSVSGQVGQEDIRVLDNEQKEDVRSDGQGGDAVRVDQEPGRLDGREGTADDQRRDVRMGSEGSSGRGTVRDDLNDAQEESAQETQEAVKAESEPAQTATEEQSAEQEQPAAQEQEEETQEEGSGEPLTLEEEVQRKNDQMAEPARNFHMDKLDLPRGKKTRFNMNVDAIRTVKQLMQENRNATAEEQNTLSKFVGWGDLAEAFDPDKKSWAKEYEQLKNLLTPEEYEAARGSTLNAHYTSIEVIQAMYEGLRGWGFKGGRMLEPAAGVGNFVGAMPLDMAQRVSSWRMVELDPITGNIAKYLYPQAMTYIEGFENVSMPDNFVDVAIGNVPFGSYGVNDSRYQKYLTASIHNYFFAKAIDKVRPGGLLFFITSRYTMDEQNYYVREHLSERAEFKGAIRLPNNAFSGNAGTQVVTDVIVLQKRIRGEVRQKYEEERWASSYVWNDGTNKINERRNEYYSQHPDMILGRESMDGSMYSGNEYTVNPIEGAKIGEQIKEALSKIKIEMTYPERLTPEEGARRVVRAQKDVKNNGYVRGEDGNIYQNIEGELQKVEMKADLQNRTLGMMGLRDTARELLGAQMENAPEEKVQELRDKLNRQYDEFVDEYGILHGRNNNNAMKGDPDRPFVMSLENYKKDVVDEGKEAITKSGKKGKAKKQAETELFKTAATKADIFRKNTIMPNVTATHADTVQDALDISMNETGMMDIARMAQLTDKSEAEVKKALLDAGTAFENEDGTLVERGEYLSGNVREKLRVMRELVKSEKKYAKNVQELEKVLPKDIAYGDIKIKMGMTWIPDGVYARFMASVLNVYGNVEQEEVVFRNPVTHQYEVTLKNRMVNRSLNEVKYGAGDATFLDMLNANLNNKRLTIKERVNGEVVVNPVKTAAAREGQERVERMFTEWIDQNEKIRTELETLYNNIFNSDVVRQYDGSKLTINGMNPEKSLRPHQRDAVQRIVQQHGNVLLAHKVGAGKTAEMAGAAMKLRQLGIINKPMFVVPKNVAAQWGDEFLKFFPAAKILVPTAEEFSPARRKELISRIATGDYDAVIVSYNQFEKISLTPERTQNFINRELEEIEAQLLQARKQGKRNSVKEIVKRKKQLETQIKGKINEDKKDGDNIYFEDTGVDALFVDEAHSFKNLGVRTSMQVNGVTTGNSNRATDMLSKVEYLQELNGGKGIVFATATPIMNSMTEMYIMQRFLQPDTLKRTGIYEFDAWANQFGEVTDVLEMKAGGDGWETKQSFSKYKNMPELQTMFRSFSDVLLHVEGLKEPKLRTGKRIIVESDPTEYQLEYIKKLGERVDKVKGGQVNPKDDNMLKINSDGVKVSLTQKMVDGTLDFGTGSKIDKCVENVIQEYRASEEEKGTQIIFCDLGVPKKDKAAKATKTDSESDESENSNSDALIDAMNEGTPDVYAEIRRQLMIMGVPANEIAFIQNYQKDDQKQALFKAVNDGKVRVLIGSTQAMGVGMNVQKRVVALHHLDCPHRPGDIEQREGRAIRQGNINEEVAIYNYVTKHTFDARRWGNIERKQGFISQVMNGTNDAREVEGDDMALSAAEVKAIASGNPILIEQAEVRAQLRKLENLQRAHTNQKRQAIHDAQEARGELARLEQRLPGVNADAAKVVDTKGDKFTIEIQGKMYTKRADAGERILKIAAKEDKAVERTRVIGHFAGLDLVINRSKVGVRGNFEYTAEINPDSASGTAQRLENTAQGIKENAKNIAASIKSYQGRIKVLEETAEEKFAQYDELVRLQTRDREIMDELNPAKDEAVISTEDEAAESGEVEHSEREHGRLSDRELIVGALETIADSERDRQTINLYRNQIRQLNEANERMRNIREQIRSYRAGAENGRSLHEMRTELNLLERRVATTDARILRMEHGEEIFRNILNAERRRVREADRARADARVERVRAQAAERNRRQAEATRERYNRRVASIRETQRRRQYLEQIERKVTDLVNTIQHPTVKKFIPTSIEDTIKRTLRGISYTSRRALNGGELTQKDQRFIDMMRGLDNVLDKMTAAQRQEGATGFEAYLDMPDGFIQDFRNVMQSVEEAAAAMPAGAYNINNMTSEQLRTLNRTLTALNRSIRNANRFLADNLHRNVDDVSRETILELNELQKGRKTTDSRGVGQYLEFKFALPINVFDRMGKGGKIVFKGLMDGQDKLAQNVRHIDEFAKATFTKKEVKEWSSDIRTIKFANGDEVQMPITHIMSLYCLARRPQARQHILGGGIRVANYDDGHGKIVSDSGHLMNMEMVGQIVSVLNERQKAVADALQQEMQETGGEWGNFVNMRRFGVRDLVENHYFPINSDGAILRASAADQGKGNPLYTLMNIDPLKQLTPKANNRLMLYNVFDVFANHMSDMAQYNAFALPLLDAIKWFNYTESTSLPGYPDEKNRHTITVHGLIREKYGETAEKYIKTLLEDVSGRKTQGADDNEGTSILRKINRTQVAFNLRVTLLQPLSVIRAALVLDPSSMRKGFTRGMGNLRANIDEMLRYSETADWKNRGFFNNDVSHSVRDMIKGEENAMEKISELGMKGPEWADKITWANIWQMCKESVQRQEGQSEEQYMQDVAEKFRDVIYRTQVADGILMKSQYMRSSGFFQKWTSAFMSEGVVSYNMLANAIWKTWDDTRRGKSVKQAIHDNGNLIGRTAAVYAISTVVTSIVELIASAWRDDDDYETFLQRMREDAIWTLVDNANPIAMVPIGSQIWDGVKTVMKQIGIEGAYGFDMTNPITEPLDMLADLIKNVNNLREGKGGTTPYGVAYNGMRLLSAVTGLPFATSAREVVSLWNNAVASWAPGMRVQTYETDASVGATAYLNAIRTGNDRRAREMIEELEVNGITGEKLEKEMQGAIRSAYTDGVVTRAEAERLLQEYGGMSKREDPDAAEQAIYKWEVYADTKSTSQYGRLYSYIDDWTDGGKAFVREIEALKGAGFTESGMRSALTSHYKDDYPNMSGSAKVAMKSHLISVFARLGMDRREAAKRIDSWK